MITSERTYRGDGTIGSARPGVVTDPLTILETTMLLFEPHSTIVVDGASVASHKARADQVSEAGWGFSEVGAWTLYHRDGRSVAVGLRDAMTPTVHFGTLFNARTDPGVVALQLERYARVTGSTWRGTCATSALAAIRLSWENGWGKPRWIFPESGAPYSGGPLIWRRPLGEWERTWGWVHTFDGNAAYLAAAINAEVAWSELEHVGPQMFDPKLPGYWQLELDVSTLEMLRDPGRPPLLRPGRRGHVCLTTPMVKLLAELGDRCEVLDSWTGVRTDHHGASARVFRTWGERMRDARFSPDLGGLDVAVKRTYTDAVGAMQRPGMRIERPDWAHTVIDLARANLYRRILQVRETEGIWPVRVHTDSVSYADGSPDLGCLAKRLGVRPGLGGFKHEDCHTVAEWEAQ